MTNVNTAQNNFSAGELSPKVYGRSDLATYFNGLRRMENFIVQTQGGALFRNGFHTVAPTKDGNKAFVYRFQYSDIESYMLEFTENNIRVYKDRGVVLNVSTEVDIATKYLESEIFELKFSQNARDLYIQHPNHVPAKLTRSSDITWTLSDHFPTGFSPAYTSQPITGITQADPAVVTYTGADTFINGDNVRITGVVGMTEVNDQVFVIVNVNTGANTFELSEVDSTAFTAYSSGGETFPASFFPSASGIYEQRLIYGGSSADPETLWFSQSADFDDFTVGTGATDGLKYTVAVGDGANNIEWIRGTEDFLAIGGVSDVLRATGGEGESAIAPDQISIKPTNTFGAADINPLGRRQTVLYIQRNQLVMLSFEKDELGIYKPIDNNLAADHITASGVTQITYQEGRPDVVWAVRTDGVLIGMTLDRSQKVSGWHRHTTQGEFVSVTTTTRDKNYDTLWACVKRTVDGVEGHYIEYLNDAPVFPRREDFVTGPLNKVADGEKYLRALYEAQKTYIHVDAAATFSGAQRAIDAGASLTVGAVTGSGVTFIAGAAVFSVNDEGNEIWVKSTSGARYGRAVISTYNSDTEVVCDIYSDFDSVTAYPAGEWYITADTVTGLDNLEGLDVSVIVDGAVHPDRTVSSGTIMLDTEASVVHVGLGYTGTLEVMDIEGGGTTGTTQTKKKSVYKVGIRLLDTTGLEFGTGYYDLEDRLLRAATDLMDNPPPLFTGDEIIKFDDAGTEDEAGWGLSKRVVIQQSLPLPAHVQLLVPYFTVTNVD